MYKGFRIKLSTMEILLIGGLLGSLVLGLWQARQLERRLEDGGRDHHLGDHHLGDHHHSDHHHTHH